MVPALSDLKYFTEIASTGSFTKAARKLGLTQPALTLSIKRLERIFNTQLFERGQQGLRLTRSGKVLKEKLDSFLTSWEQLQSDVGRSLAEPKGVVTFACHASLAMHVMPRFIPEQLTRFPKIELKVAHDGSRKNTERVIQSEVDFAFVVNPVKHPDLVIRPLYKDSVGFWSASRSSATSSPLIYNPAMLETARLLRQAANLGWLFEPVLAFENLDVIAELLTATRAVGILPETIARRARLRRLKQLPAYEDEICLIYRPIIRKSEAVRCIVDLIEAVFR